MTTEEIARLREQATPASSLASEWVWLRRATVLAALDDLEYERERVEYLSSEVARLEAAAWDGGLP
jgi:hypothetical protein